MVNPLKNHPLKFGPTPSPKLTHVPGVPKRHCSRCTPNGGFVAAWERSQGEDNAGHHGGFSHRGTPSHPFIDGIFQLLLGCIPTCGNPHIYKFGDGIVIHGKHIENPWRIDKCATILNGSLWDEVGPTHARLSRRLAVGYFFPLKGQRVTSTSWTR